MTFGIGSELVGVDAWIRRANEHFVVAGVGKVEAVRDASDAAFVLVAVDLTLLGDNGQDEREERFAALFGGVAQNSFLQVVFVAQLPP